MMGSVANHLWQSTIVTALAVLLALALRRERARVRYWVWLAASLKFLIPFGALVALGSHIDWRPAVAATSPAVTLIRSVSQPYAQTQLNLLAAAGPEVVGSSVARMLPAVLVGTWLVGFAICVFFWVTRWRRLAAVVHGASHLESGRELDSLRRFEKALGIARPVPLLASSDALEPGVFGIVKPVLLWPAQIGPDFDEAQVEAIVAHEVCHIRHRDNLIASLHMMVEAVFWFHPLVWWIGARLIDERERACDEEVIELGHAPHVYAQSILKTCELCVELPLICAAGVTGSDLKRRIVEIMTGPTRRNLSVSRKVLLGFAASVAIVAPIALGLILGPRLQAQQSTAQLPSFEVASVKPNRSGDGQMRMQIEPGGRIELSNVTLRLMIRNAYRIQEFQVIGGPDWLASDRFDVTAKAAGNPSADQMGLMLQKLLEERFKLKIQHETRDLPVYALVMAKSDGTKGPQLRPSDLDCAAFRRGNEPPPGPGQAPPQCGFQMGFGSIHARGVTMGSLASSLSMRLNRVVLDRTGLSGNLDIDLTWTPEQLPSRAAGTPADQPVLVNGVVIDPNGPSIFTAVQEQLGLKLESTKGPVDVLVIDRAEQPTPN